MKSQKLLDEIMRLDSIVEMKIYRINDNSYEQIDLNVQKSLNSFVKDRYEDNSKSSKTSYLFL